MPWYVCDRCGNAFRRRKEDGPEHYCDDCLEKVVDEMITEEESEQSQPMECSNCGRLCDRESMKWDAGQFYCYECAEELGIGQEDTSEYYDEWM